MASFCALIEDSERLESVVVVPALLVVARGEAGHEAHEEVGHPEEDEDVEDEGQAAKPETESKGAEHRHGHDHGHAHAHAAAHGAGRGRLAGLTAHATAGRHARGGAEGGTAHPAARPRSLRVLGGDHIRDEDAAGDHRGERHVERGVSLLGLPLVILLESCDGREASRGDGARDGAGPTWRGRRYLTARSELVRVEKFEINGAGL